MKKSFVILLILISSSFSTGSILVSAVNSTSNAPSKGWNEVANENYWYSRYYLGNLEMRSGAGLSMVFSPTFQGDLSMMMQKIGMAANLTRATPPANAFPIFAEFASATPQYSQAVDVANPGDFATLRWDLTGADRDIYPASIAQAGLKNVLWSEDFFGANHFIENGSSTDLAVDTSPMSQASGTIALGEGKTTPTDYTTEGFRGFVLTAEVINKMKLLKGMLAVNVTSGQLDGGLDPMTNAGSYYFPHQYTYTTAMVTPNGGMMAMPKPGNFSVVDATSTLWDQLSLLWMSSKFFAWSSQPEQDDVFGGNGTGVQPFPGAMADTGMPGPEDLSKGLAKTVWMGLLANHWDNTSRTFVDTANYSSGSFTKGSTVTTADAGRALIAVDQWSKATNNGMGQNQYILDQVDFLINNLQRADGGFDNSYDLQSNTASSTARTLDTQAGAIRGLALAYSISGDSEYKERAVKAFDFMETKLWDDEAGIFMSEEGASSSVFSTRDVASTIAGLREIMAIGDTKASPLAYYRFLQFFISAVDESGFQQSEGDPTGAGTDSDSIPAPPMQTANGASHGTAPMPVGEITYSNDKWSVTDYTFYSDIGMYAANEFFLSGSTGPLFKVFSEPTVSYADAVSTYYGITTSTATSGSTTAGDSSKTQNTPLDITVLSTIAVLVPIILIRKKRKN